MGLPLVDTVHPLARSLEGIHAQQAAVDRLPDDHPDKPALLSEVANAFMVHFKEQHDDGELSRAIKLHRAAVDLTPDTDPAKPARLSALSRAHLKSMARRALLVQQNMRASLSLDRRALELLPGSDPKRASHITRVARYVQQLAAYAQLGDDSDEERAPPVLGAPSTATVAHAMCPPMTLWWHGDESLVRGIVIQEDASPLSEDGAWGTLFVGRWVPHFGDPLPSVRVAMKMLRFTKPNIALRALCRREARTWSQLEHKNLLPFFGTCEGTGDMRLFLISPMMGNGNAVVYCKLHLGAPGLQTGIIAQTAEALLYLHTPTSSKGCVVHGDLKGENILISDTGDALLADFGLSMCLDEDIGSRTGATTTSFRIGGTPRFMAPEILCDDRPKTPVTDVYAFGMVVYQLFAGEPPFASMSDGRLILHVAMNGRPKRPATFEHGDMWNLATECWRHDPEERPSTAAVVERTKCRLPPA